MRFFFPFLFYSFYIHRRKEYGETYTKKTRWFAFAAAAPVCRAENNAARRINPLCFVRPARVVNVIIPRRFSIGDRGLWEGVGKGITALEKIEKKEPNPTRTILPCGQDVCDGVAGAEKDENSQQV